MGKSLPEVHNESIFDRLDRLILSVDLYLETWKHESCQQSDESRVGMFRGDELVQLLVLAQLFMIFLVSRIVVDGSIRRAALILEPWFEIVLPLSQSQSKAPDQLQR